MIYLTRNSILANVGNNHRIVARVTFSNNIDVGFTFTIKHYSYLHRFHYGVEIPKNTSHLFTILLSGLVI
jgi:hypothetical protein